MLASLLLKIDDAAHKAHVPPWIQAPLCDLLDLSLGITWSELRHKVTHAEIARIREGLDATERGETVDLGSFAQYIDEDFYEDDEPVEKIRAAFERGEKFVTARPAGEEG